MNGRSDSVVIRASGLTKRFDEIVAVDDVSFEVRRGETYGLLGPNGAGKTTTMRLVSGLSPLTDGDLTVAGIDVSREAWREAGHNGQGRIALGFHMFCHEDREEARRIAQPNIDAYFKSLVVAAELDSGWGAGTSSSDYPNYDSHMDKLRQANFDTLLDSGTIWVGSPSDVREQIASYHDAVGGFDTASLQVNFHCISIEDAASSMRLFSSRVMPSFRG